MSTHEGAATLQIVTRQLRATDADLAAVCGSTTYCNELATEQGGPMSDVVYTSRVRIEKREGPVRDAWLPAHDGPVRFGVHGAVAEHYKRGSEEEHTTTLDYVVAAAAG